MQLRRPDAGVPARPRDGDTVIGRASIVAVAMLIAAVSQSPPPPDDDYVAAVRAYRSGDAEAAVARFAGLDRQHIKTGLGAFARLVLRDDAEGKTPSTAELVEAAVAIHTEVALRPRVPATAEMEAFHLGTATSIVDLGVPLISARIQLAPQKPSVIHEDPAVIHQVTPEFRRRWYVTVITAMLRLGRVAGADWYLEKARALFPADDEVLLLSGMADEMHATPRVITVTPVERQDALERADGHLRVSLAVADRMETRLRLGRVLQQRGQIVEARELLTGVAGVEDARQAYLASLFLGGLEDAAGNPAAAESWYRRAAARIPSAQVAQLAASELRHRAGERRQAADDLPSALGVGNTDDPWWMYLFGEYWRIDALLDALRVMSRS
jgi:hypothetical protein